MRVFTVSLGCDKNKVDTAHMLGSLIQRGYELTDEEEKAEAAVVNTCCFIHDAKEESVREILALADRKNEGKLKALIVTGCLAERYKEEIIREIPEVDAVIGTASVDRISEALDEVSAGHRALFFDDINRSFKFAGERVMTPDSYVSYLKIAEGCDKRCTYCIIPSLRGRYRSFPMDDLVDEAVRLGERGARELVVVAQETTRYGMDLDGKKHLPELLRRICERAQEISWVRVLYCYPEEIDDELIEVIRTEEKIVKYRDMPIQSGSDRILRRMGRRTDAASIRALVKKIRARIPGIALRTTLITGFPGEEAEDHRETMSLVKDLRFDRLGVFPFSREEGTPAYRMRGQVASSLAKRRRTQILKAQQEISHALHEGLIGKTLPVFCEGTITEEDRTVSVGRTMRDAPDVDGYIFFEAKREHMSGDIVRVRVTGADVYDLYGREV